MMSFLGEWIKHIVLLILLASFVDLILPNSNMKRYVKLVVGLLLLLLILSPILHLFKFDYDRMLLSVDHLLKDKQSTFQQQLEERQMKLQELQDETVLDEVATSWGEEMRQKIESNFDITVQQLQISLIKNANEVDIASLYMEVAQSGGPLADAQEVSTSDIGEMKPVKPVIIQVNRTHTARHQEQKITEEQKKLQKEVLKFVQVEWNISVDKISFSWIGGDQNGQSNLE